MPKKKQPQLPKNLIQLTIMTSVPLIKLKRENQQYGGLGTGVMIQYRDRFFFCTVQHNINNPEKMLCIDTSRTNGDKLETIKLEGFSTVKRYQLPETTEEALKQLLANVDTTGKYVDIAYGAIEKPFLVPQSPKILVFDGKKFPIPDSIKACVIPTIDVEFDKTSRYSFHGRIKPELAGGKGFGTEERYIFGMQLVDVLDFWLKFDLGEPIGDHANFEGCSGAPIFDFDGNLVALLANGEEDVNKPYIYGFRIDKLLEFIDLASFDDEKISVRQRLT